MDGHCKWVVDKLTSNYLYRDDWSTVFGKRVARRQMEKKGRAINVQNLSVFLLHKLHCQHYLQLTHLRHSSSRSNL